MFFLVFRLKMRFIVEKHTSYSYGETKGTFLLVSHTLCFNRGTIEMFFFVFRLKMRFIVEKHTSYPYGETKGTFLLVSHTLCFNRGTIEMFFFSFSFKDEVRSPKINIIFIR